MKHPYFDSLKALREDLLSAYSDSTGKELDVSKVQKYQGDAVIKAILDDMLRIFVEYKDVIENIFLVKDRTVLDYRTVYKVLVPEKATSDISQKSRIKINEYYLLVKRQKSQKETNNNSFSVPGAFVINENFKLAKQNIEKFSAVKFYTSILSPDLQWAAVFNGFDIERDQRAEVKKEVLQCFKRESRVCAVITGLSGSGKTVFLRRLASEVFKDERFIVLWIYDFSAFNSAMTSLAVDKNQYLIIVDDWNKHARNGNNIEQFLTILENSSNFRLLIGDSKVHREYEKYIYSNNIFTLSENENISILKRISFKVTKWRDTINLFLENHKKLFNAPLFLILFIIANVYSNNSNEKELDFNDIISQFRKLVSDDLNKLFKKVPGIAVTLYYWANLYKDFSSPISWRAFLYLADYYNEGLEISKHIKDFNPNHPIVKILSRYIYIEELPHPELEGEKACYFLHDYIAIEALSRCVNEDWYFDNEIIVEMFSELVRKHEYLFNIDFGSYITDNEIDFDDEIANIFNNNATYPYITISEAVSFNYHIQTLFDNVINGGLDENDILLNVVTSLSIMFHRRYSPEKSIKFTIEGLIKRGCRSGYINHIWDNKLFDLESFDEYVRPIFEGIWDRILSKDSFDNKA